MQEEYQNCCRRVGGVKNVDIFVDKYVKNCKYLGIRFSTWTKIGGQAYVLLLSVVLFNALLGILYKQDFSSILYELLVGIWVMILVSVVDNIVNLRGKEELLRLLLMEQIENHPYEKEETSEETKEQAEEKAEEKNERENTEEVFFGRMEERAQKHGKTPKLSQKELLKRQLLMERREKEKRINAKLPEVSLEEEKVTRENTVLSPEEQEVLQSVLKEFFV